MGSFLDHSTQMLGLQHQAHCILHSTCENKTCKQKMQSSDYRACIPALLMLTHPCSMASCSATLKHVLMDKKMDILVRHDLIPVLVTHLVKLVNADDPPVCQDHCPCLQSRPVCLLRKYSGIIVKFYDTEIIRSSRHKQQDRQQTDKLTDRLTDR